LENNYHTYADVNSQIIIPKHGFEEFTVYDESEVEPIEDTQIVENNLQVRQLDQDIYRYDAQLELLNLYSKVADAI
jgi:hypothetical protein